MERAQLKPLLLSRSQAQETLLRLTGLIWVTDHWRAKQCTQRYLTLPPTPRYQGRMSTELLFTSLCSTPTPATTSVGERGLASSDEGACGSEMA